MDSIQKQLAERRQRLAGDADAESDSLESKQQPADVPDVNSHASFADDRHQLEQEIVALSSREQELLDELDKTRRELLARRARLGVLRNAGSDVQRSDVPIVDQEVVEAPEEPRHRAPELTQEEKDHEIAVMLQRQWEREDEQAETGPPQARSGFSFAMSRRGDGPATISYSSRPERSDLASLISGGRDPLSQFGRRGSGMDLGMAGTFGLLGPRPHSAFSRIGFPPLMFGSSGAPFGFGGMNLDLDNMDHDQILRLQEMIGHVPRGASAQEISQLPTSKFYGGDAKEEATEQDDDRKKCSICLEDFAEGDDIRTLPCFHIFHADEIDQWLGQNSKCPICREPIQSGQRDGEMGN